MHQHNNYIVLFIIHNVYRLGNNICIYMATKQKQYFFISIGNVTDPLENTSTLSISNETKHTWSYQRRQTESSDL